jgi:hypothetical protein
MPITQCDGVFCFSRHHHLIDPNSKLLTLCSCCLSFCAPLQAVNSFLYEMGLTFEQLLARPVLVDLILSYHTIPGATITNWYSKNSADGNKDLISSSAEQPTVMATGVCSFWRAAFLCRVWCTAFVCFA